MKHITKWQGVKEVGRKHSHSHQIIPFHSFDRDSKKLAFENHIFFTIWFLNAILN